MNKKLLSIIAVLGLVAILTFGYNQAFAPESVEGQKEVSIEVIAEDQGIDRTFSFNTDHEFLYDLLLEKEEELGAIFETYDFGTMVIGMMDYQANPSENEYFHVTINSDDATTGPEGIPLQDQDTYRFKLTNY